MGAPALAGTPAQPPVAAEPPWLEMKSAMPLLVQISAPAFLRGGRADDDAARPPLLLTLTAKGLVQRACFVSSVAEAEPISPHSFS